MKYLIGLILLMGLNSGAFAAGLSFSAGQEFRPEKTGDGSTEYRAFTTIGGGIVFNKSHYAGIRYHTASLSSSEGNILVDREIYGLRLDYGYSIQFLKMLESTFLLGVGAEREALKYTVSSSVTNDDSSWELLTSAGLRLLTTGMFVVGAEVRINSLNNWDPSVFPTGQIILGLKF